MRFQAVEVVESVSIPQDLSLVIQHAVCLCNCSGATSISVTMLPMLHGWMKAGGTYQGQILHQYGWVSTCIRMSFLHNWPRTSRSAGKLRQMICSCNIDCRSIAVCPQIVDTQGCLGLTCVPKNGVVAFGNNEQGGAESVCLIPYLLAVFQQLAAAAALRSEPLPCGYPQTSGTEY